MTAELELVVAGLLVSKNRVLLGHRQPNRLHFPNCWDFPGGHIEADETERMALRRELHEELGIEVDIGVQAEDVRIFGDGYDLKIWTIREWSGEVANRAPEEHDALEWFDSNELASITLASAGYLQICLDAIAAGESVA